MLYCGRNGWKHQDQPCHAVRGAALPPGLRSLHEILELSVLRCPLDSAPKGEDEDV